MLKEFWLLLNACDIFSISTALNVVEGRRLIHLGSFEIGGKRGRWWSLVPDKQSNHWIRNPLHRLEGAKSSAQVHVCSQEPHLELLPCPMPPV